MIDFRYHLVSIVSIFLALAVGIVLGAGPLKEDIGNTLTTEVTRLREDRTQLRAELDRVTKGAAARDEFTAASNRTLLAGRLQGTTVTVVVLPGADGDLVKATTATLTSAGARIGSTVTVLDAWTDPQRQEARTALGRELAPTVQAAVDADDAEILDLVLARSVLTKAGGLGAAGAALERLREADLIRYTPDEVTVATAAVVISGPVPADEDADRPARTEALRRLAGIIDAAGSGAVLATSSADPSDPASSSVVAAAREEADLSRQLSTVDDAESPMGQASIVFALLEQLAGSSGQYGLGADASAPFPALATR